MTVLRNEQMISKLENKEMYAKYLEKEQYIHISHC